MKTEQILYDLYLISSDQNQVQLLLDVQVYFGMCQNVQKEKNKK